MPDTLKDFIDASLIRLWNQDSDLYNAATDMRYLGDHIRGQNWAAAEVDCDNVAGHLETLRLTTVPWPPNGTWSDITEALYWINDNWPTADGYELTWLKVIESYLDADDDHRSAWQLLADAYHASMYDKPFDLEYHKTWVARFKEWR